MKNTEAITSDWLYLYGGLSSRSIRFTLLPSLASSSGVLLSLFTNLMSAPLFTNSWATSNELFIVAMCKGVRPSSSCMLTVAPACSRYFVTSSRLLRNEVLYHQYNSHSHALHALHLSTFDQLNWRRHSRQQ